MTRRSEHIFSHQSCGAQRYTSYLCNVAHGTTVSYMSYLGPRDDDEEEEEDPNDEAEEADPEADMYCKYNACLHGPRQPGQNGAPSRAPSSRSSSRSPSTMAGRVLLFCFALHPWRPGQKGPLTRTFLKSFVKIATHNGR